MEPQPLGRQRSGRSDGSLGLWLDASAPARAASPLHMEDAAGVPYIDPGHRRHEVQDVDEVDDVKPGQARYGSVLMALTTHPASASATGNRLRLKKGDLWQACVNVAALVLACLPVPAVGPRRPRPRNKKRGSGFGLSCLCCCEQLRL